MRKPKTATSTSNTVTTPVIDISNDIEFEPLSNEEINELLTSLQNDGIELYNNKAESENKENAPISNSQSVETVNNSNL